jgi:NADP-dependent 3-hydroxy acid dehydrogenase YdfG
MSTNITKKLAGKVALVTGGSRGIGAATVRNQVLLSKFTDFENYSVFKPDARHENSVNAMFDQVIARNCALKALRKEQA